MGQRKSNAAHIRALLAQADGSTKGRGAGYGEAARREAAAYARSRIASGATLSAVASEIGIQAITLRRWVARSGSGFVEVSVVRAPEPAIYTLVSPSGWRVEGLDLDALRALVGSTR